MNYFSSQTTVHQKLVATKVLPILIPKPLNQIFHVYPEISAIIPATNSHWCLSGFNLPEIYEAYLQYLHCNQNPPGSNS